jgi:hypothetical protein
MFFPYERPIDTECIVRILTVEDCFI